MTVYGKNHATGKDTVFKAPKVNLTFEGDFALSGDDFIKASLSGKLLKIDGEDIFTMEDIG